MFTLKGEEYSRFSSNYKYTPTNRACYTLIRAAEKDDGRTWTLGTVFLQYLYTEFHLDRELVCFARNAAFHTQIHRAKKNSGQIVSKY